MPGLFHFRSKSKSTIAPGDKPEVLRRGEKVKPEQIRELAELIRTRYRLDVLIWSSRKVKPHSQHIVQDHMRRSDATLGLICDTIKQWNKRDLFESQSDWEKFRAIKTRIEEDGKRKWADNPPWDG